MANLRQRLEEKIAAGIAATGKTKVPPRSAREAQSPHTHSTYHCGTRDKPVVLEDLPPNVCHHPRYKEYLLGDHYFPDGYQYGDVIQVKGKEYKLTPCECHICEDWGGCGGPPCWKLCEEDEPDSTQQEEMKTQQEVKRPKVIPLPWMSSKAIPLPWKEQDNRDNSVVSMECEASQTCFETDWQHKVSKIWNKTSWTSVCGNYLVTSGGKTGWYITVKTKEQMLDWLPSVCLLKERKDLNIGSIEAHGPTKKRGGIIKICPNCDKYDPKLGHKLFKICRIPCVFKDIAGHISTRISSCKPLPIKVYIEPSEYRNTDSDETSESETETPNPLKYEMKEDIDDILRRRERRRKVARIDSEEDG